LRKFRLARIQGRASPWHFHANQRRNTITYTVKMARHPQKCHEQNVRGPLIRPTPIRSIKAAIIIPTDTLKVSTNTRRQPMMAGNCRMECCATGHGTGDQFSYARPQEATTKTDKIRIF
jgi:hypothetical protein